MIKKIYDIQHTRIGIGKFSDSVEVIGIVIRKSVNGINVVIWIDIVNIEIEEKEITTTTNWNNVWEKKEKKTTTETATRKLKVQVTESVFGGDKHL